MAEIKKSTVESGGGPTYSGYLYISEFDGSGNGEHSEKAIEHLKGFTDVITVDKQLSVDKAIVEGEALPKRLNGTPTLVVMQDENTSQFIEGASLINRWLNETKDKLNEPKKIPGGIAANSQSSQGMAASVTSGVKREDFTGGKVITQDNAMEFITSETSTNKEDQSDFQKRLDEINKQRSLDLDQFKDVQKSMPS